MDHTAQGETPVPTAPLTSGAPSPRGEWAQERRGCLFALSQPPLMIFLAVIGCLLLMAAVHDLFML
jgi:hypothetical protein